MSRFAPTCDLSLGKIPESCKSIVIGIDFGTAYSGIALAFKAYPQAVDYCTPTPGRTYQTKVPTVVLVHGDGSWIVGEEAEKKYSKLINDAAGSSISSHLYRSFKLLLKDQTDDVDMNSLRAISVCGNEHGLLDLFAKMMISMKTDALAAIAKNTDASNPWDLTNDIQWVLTVPAIWGKFGKEFMRRAAVLAGLVELEDSEQLMVVVEPECAALAVHVDAYNFGVLREGNCFMMLDCGGGTVDITTYQVTSLSPLTLRPILKPSGGAWGDEHVNLEFKKFLQELLGPELYKPDDRPHAFYLVEQEFNRLKRGNDPVRDGRPRPDFRHTIRRRVTISLDGVLSDPAQLATLVNAYNKRNNIDNPDNRLAVVDGKLSMPESIIEHFFEPVVECIVGEVRRVISDAANQHVFIKHIVIVGGFGSNKVLIKHIDGRFHMKNGVRVLSFSTSSGINGSSLARTSRFGSGSSLLFLEPTAQAAVLKGAVYAGLYKNVIQGPGI